MQQRFGALARVQLHATHAIDAWVDRIVPLSLTRTGQTRAQLGQEHGRGQSWARLEAWQKVHWLAVAGSLCARGSLKDAGQRGFSLRCVVSRTESAKYRP